MENLIFCAVPLPKTLKTKCLKVSESLPKHIQIR